MCHQSNSATCRSPTPKLRYRFKPLKPRSTSTTNLRRRRTHEEHEECEEQRISNKLTTRDSLQFPFQKSSIHPLTKLKDILCSSQNHITTNPINKSCKEIESEDHSFVITENCITQSSIQIRICETILLV